MKVGYIMEENKIRKENLEEDEPVYFRYSASLRIFSDDIMDLDAITNYLGITPSYSHLKGEMNYKKTFENSMWLFEVDLPEETHLDFHIQLLWSLLKPLKEKIIKLKEDFKVDIFCGYRSNSDTAGLVLEPSNLEMFIELNIPFQLSIIIA